MKSFPKKTDFPVGTEVYFIQRVRYLDDIAKMVDTNLLRKDIIKDLTKEIAQKSLFEYYTKVLDIELTTIKRTVTVERTTPFDEHYSDTWRLQLYGCYDIQVRISTGSSLNTLNPVTVLICSHFTL